MKAVLPGVGVEGNALIHVDGLNAPLAAEQRGRVAPQAAHRGEAAAGRHPEHLSPEGGDLLREVAPYLPIKRNDVAAGGGEGGDDSGARHSGELWSAAHGRLRREARVADARCYGHQSDGGDSRH